MFAPQAKLHDQERLVCDLRNELEKAANQQGSYKHLTVQDIEGAPPSWVA